MNVHTAHADIMQLMAAKGRMPPPAAVATNNPDAQSFSEMMDEPSTSQAIKDGASLEIKSDDRQWQMQVKDAAGNQYEWGMDSDNNFYVTRNGDAVLSGLEADDDQIQIEFDNGGVQFFKDGSHLSEANMTFTGPTEVTHFSEGARNAEHGQTYFVSSSGQVPYAMQSFLENERAESITESDSLIYDPYSPDVNLLTDDVNAYEDAYVTEQALAPGSSAAELQKFFQTEGNSPYVNDGTLQFNALTSGHTTPNGNGWREELKISKDLRTSMGDVQESFTTNIKAELSDGSKLIAAQYHAADTGTLMKTYISDTNESGFLNSKANDGIFDVYVRMTDEAGVESKKALGTIQSGDDFDLSVVNDFGKVTVSGLGNSFSTDVKDGPGSYFKFGNYLQAQDAATGKDVGSSSDFGDFYASKGIVESTLTFSNTNYTRMLA